MSYTRPAGNAADFIARGLYGRPAGNAANFQAGTDGLLSATLNTTVPVVFAAAVAVDRTNLQLVATVGVALSAAVEFVRLPLTANVQGRWTTSRAADRVTGLSGRASRPLDDTAAVRWLVGAPMQTHRGARWSVAAPTDTRKAAPWTPRGRHADDSAHAPWGRSAARDRERLAPWTPRGRHVDDSARAPWGRSTARDRAREAPWGVPQPRDPAPVHNGFPRAAGRDLTRWVPWSRYSRALQPGWGVITPPGPTPDEHGTWVVPVRTVYIMLNEVTLTRVSDNAAIPATAISLSLDADSWTWAWSARVPYSALELVGGGTEVQATVNGDPVRLVVQSLSRERVFGKDWLAVKGQGRSALLGAPYSPVLNFDNASEARTAQQLAGDALLDNGVPIGWAVDWQIADWLVPAGAWALQGTRIDALNAIAAAAGGYVQPHAVDQEVRILHRYPAAPWDWGDLTPDVVLPAAVVTREGIEWLSKPVYDRVFVSGQGVGVLGQITRTGTDGSRVAPMVTEPLATASALVLQRGRTVLSDTGDQLLATLRLPVLEETGLLVPGKLVSYVDGATTRRGIVRSLQVDVSHVQAWQTIRVEAR